MASARRRGIIAALCASAMILSPAATVAQEAFWHLDAPRPRTDETLSDAGFIRLKGHCLEIFQREVRRG